MGIGFNADDHRDTEGAEKWSRKDEGRFLSAQADTFTGAKVKKSVGLLRSK
jgi:hypothetical protein